MIKGVACIIEVDFEKSANRIAEFRPDAIVLDLMQGHQSTILPGQHTWKRVWEMTFCPIIIYTGSDADLEPPVPSNHPFVKRIQKGGSSETRVVEALRGFAPAVESVGKLRAEVDAVIHKVLRDTAGDGHLPLDDSSYLLHAGRRRIAATMDDPTLTDNRAMQSWEQYLIPATGESPLTADVLRKRDARWDDPNGYRLVLTPSCDLVKRRFEPTIVVARCEEVTSLARKLSLSPAAKNTEKATKDVISKALSTGVFQGLLPLPAFPSRLPIMIANLKSLEVIPYESVGPPHSSTHEFLRIASIDSPFREQVSWAYLTTAGRPGMPDREEKSLKSWAEEIVNTARKQE